MLAPQCRVLSETHSEYWEAEELGVGGREREEQLLHCHVIMKRHTLGKLR